MNLRHDNHHSNNDMKRTIHQLDHGPHTQRFVYIMPRSVVVVLLSVAQRELVGFDAAHHARTGDGTVAVARELVERLARILCHVMCGVFSVLDLLVEGGRERSRAAYDDAQRVHVAPAARSRELLALGARKRVLRARKVLRLRADEGAASIEARARLRP
jgi:hypothetical protein